jgi:nucleoside-diphosphate-sugar epimerase
VLGLSRDPDRAAAVEAKGCRCLVGSVDDADVIYKACRDVNAVIHAAIETSDARALVDATAVRLILEGLRSSGKPFIYTSGTWVYGDTRGRTVGEASALDPPAHVEWRPAVETMVLDAKHHAVEGMVLRPGTVFGRGAGRIAGMFAQARQEGVIRIPGTGENHWSTIHVDDLAALYVHAVERPAGGEVFIATGGLPTPVRQIALAVANLCGIPGKVSPTPMGFARTQLGALADCLAMDQKAASTKAARFFGWAVKWPSVVEEIAAGDY